MRSQSSEDLQFYISTVNCTFREVVSRLFNLCNGNVTLEADPVAFVKSQSSVVTRINSSDSNETFSYNLCIFPPNIFQTEYIGCTQNSSEVAIEVDWRLYGLTNISVFVFEGTTFMGCAKTSINVAS